MKKRFYAVNEKIWVMKDQVEGIVQEINTKELTMTVLCEDDLVGASYTVVGKMWEFDKIRNKKPKAIKPVVYEKDTLYMSKIKPDAKLPQKAGEDEAGYDVYAYLEPVETENGIVREMLIPRLTKGNIPTGIATAISSGKYLNFANERGSTGMIGLLMLSGVVDGTYRGEVFLLATPLFKDILITDQVEKVEETADLIKYPYSKAICQMIEYDLGTSKPKEISFEELQSIPSTRGTGALGSSGK